MPSFNDPIWSVIGVIATIFFGIVGIIGVVITFLQLTQTRKLLSFEYQSITQIFKIAKGFQEQIEIKIKGEAVRDVYLMIIRFVNSGRTSIRPDDFVHPLKLSLKNGKILSVEIENTDPPELGDVVETKDATSITFKKLLLNRNDEFVLKLLVSDFKGNIADVNIQARIDGVKGITELKNSDLIKALKNSPSALLHIIAILILGPDLMSVDKSLDKLESILKESKGNE